MYFIQKLALLLLPVTPVTGVSPHYARKDFLKLVTRDSDHQLYAHKARDSNEFLSFKGTPPGEVVQDGVKLRVLSVGSSITVGFGPGTDGNGYRERLRDDLSENEVVWAGTENDSKADMEDGYFVSCLVWQTVKYISDHVDPSLEQRPNLILIFAGTNDMSSDPNISTEGNDPKETTDRLKSMVEKMMSQCPDASIILGMVTNVCDNEKHHDQRESIKAYRGQIADMAAELKAGGAHVLAADFGPFHDKPLSDCVHPTQEGYQIMGDWWYDFVHQIPEGWIKDPVGDDPVRY
ncbi:acetylxylan esterase [Fusarium beomiforme]|uniref:Acetylxylan esterase n=1 Tax=Fusarium beomiforme TaxID=44412 RepID=A0A9P5AJY5_9HYPO|nr:acetylxylan esterase [Fusarium beomiforme]